ncbi:MAG: RNA polymerase sporulation sigma factor SigE [Candidatus Paraimprobicoccus trichonymphae]|uniref:RNA polymerase sigma factor n=1 Tax=Candidatus Paraimprobicoccus trichonymphae TaxID=3033793 RepID=A0AA48HWB9_9FIRM|nr:MAG: RNA polymerase sporulation sigma factor SigE [Candidatus Paraimprobicoccus trichonymphae]
MTIIDYIIKIYRKFIFKLRKGIFYINGPEILPAPLSKEEESKIMVRIVSGDETAKELLITHNLRLVVYIAKKFDNFDVNVEDLISIGTIGLIKAVKTFSPEKNIKLATYASRCIENEILMYLRKSSQTKKETSIDVSLNVDLDGKEFRPIDKIRDETDVVAERLEQESDWVLLTEAVENLGKRDKLIMQLRFGLNSYKEHTQKEVADSMGISQSYISRLEKKIIGKLKKDLEKVY